jgi:methyltransferase family protein
MSGPTLAPLGDELLDHPDADPETVRESLRHIARANRWFGGWWAVRHGLARLLRDTPRGSSLTLLDIGTGLGDLPASAVRWASRRGIRLRPLGLERHPMAARLARDSGVASLVGCASRLPFAPGSVDLVIVSQVLHHLAPASIVDLLGSAGAIARHGVVVADLRRSALALAGFWIGSRLLRFDPATRMDGLTSVRRGFLPGELQALLSRAGVTAKVERTPGFRLVAAWPTGSAGPCER